MHHGPEMLPPTHTRPHSTRVTSFWHAGPPSRPFALCNHSICALVWRGRRPDRDENRLSAREKRRAVIHACARHPECCGAAHQPMRKSLCAGCTGKLCCRACQGNDACDKDDVKPTRPKLQTYKEHSLPGRARPGCWPYTHNLEWRGSALVSDPWTVPGYFTKPRHAQSEAVVVEAAPVAHAAPPFTSSRTGIRGW